jgi:hypothetical protein
MMMELVLTREPSAHGATFGALTVDGVFECWTLEDETRPPGEKIPGRTAIPAGRYQIRLTHSPRFQRVLPLLLEVPNFEGVRIHIGNTTKDTEGCILVGNKRSNPDSDQPVVYLSAQAFHELMERLSAAHRVDEEIWITVQDAE